MPLCHISRSSPMFLGSRVHRGAPVSQWAPHRWPPTCVSVSRLFILFRLKLNVSVSAAAFVQSRRAGAPTDKAVHLVSRLCLLPCPGSASGKHSARHVDLLAYPGLTPLQVFCERISTADCFWGYPGISEASQQLSPLTLPCCSLCDQSHQGLPSRRAVVALRERARNEADRI